MTSEFSEKIEGKVYQLLAEKKFKQAFELIEKYIYAYGEDSDLMKLRIKVEDAIRNENEKVIKNKLNELKPLWKEEKYSEILKELTPLLKIAPNNIELIKAIEEAQLKYKNYYEIREKLFFEEQTKILEKLMVNNEQKFIEKLFEIEKINFKNPRILQFTVNYREKLIIKKIKEKEKLLKSEKYLEIDNFLSQIKKINSKSPALIKLEKEINSRRYIGQLDEKGEFLYKSTENLVTLFKLKKYEKAIQMAEELLEIDKSNKIAKKILNDSRRKFFRQTRNKVIAKMIEENKSNTEEYRKQPELYIKI